MTRRTLLSTLPVIASGAFDERAPLRVLIITGGHKFEEEAFFAAFRSMPALTITHLRHGAGAEEKLHPSSRNEFDVMVFYDMHQKPEPHWNNWMQLLGQGMPSVFLHHALGGYKSVPEYVDVVGGRAAFTQKIAPGTINTLWKHDEEIPVSIADRQHPITAGISDFTIHDEVYRGYYVRPDVHTLLTTQHPLNDYRIGWVHKFMNSPVVYLQLGHDHAAYENPNFRRLVERSVRWAAGKL